MIFQHVKRGLDRAISVLSTEGVGVAARRLAARAGASLGRSGNRHAEYVRTKASQDAAFDGAKGSDTGGIQRLYKLSIASENARFGTDHIASVPEDFRRAMTQIGIPFDEFSFIDLGSGKGRALMLAADYPFRSITGVEFAREMHEIAERNIASLGDERITSIHGDAVDVVLPAGKLLLFMFNPFDDPIVRKVAHRAREHARATREDIVILYMNPRFSDGVLEAGWAPFVEGQGFIAYRPSGD